MEVCGSSPHGPTILINELRKGYLHQIAPILVQLCRDCAVRIGILFPELLERRSAGLFSDGGVVAHHPAIDVAGNAHDRFIARATFG